MRRVALRPRWRCSRRNQYMVAISLLPAGSAGSCAGRSSGLRRSASRGHVTRLRVAGDDRRVRGVAVGVELDAEELQAVADARADRRGVLADARREDQRVQPAQSGGQSRRGTSAPGSRRARPPRRRAGPSPRASSRSRMSALVPETPSRPACLLTRSAQRGRRQPARLAAGRAARPGRGRRCACPSPARRSG